MGDGTEPKNALLVLSAPGFLREHRLREAEPDVCLHAVMGFVSASQASLTVRNTETEHLIFLFFFTGG